MSNKVQINCNPQNKRRVQDLKNIRRSLQMTQHEIQKLKLEIEFLNKQVSINMPIKDPYHPLHGMTQMFADDPYHSNYLSYNHRIDILESYQKDIKTFQAWIRVISSELSKYAC